jgi:hypothetical protein
MHFPIVLIIHTLKCLQTVQVSVHIPRQCGGYKKKIVERKANCRLHTNDIKRGERGEPDP